MATLTSSYQYLGRSTAMASMDTNLRYYLLLYAKTSPNNTSGFHTVTIRGVLASTNDNARFYQYDTVYKGSINSVKVFSGYNAPDRDWELGAFTAGGVSYKEGTIIGEGSTTVDCTDGHAHEIPLSFSWTFGAGPPAHYTPIPNTTREVSVTALLSAIPRGTFLDSVTGGTYLNETMTYKYTPQNANYYTRCNISVNLSGTYIAIRSILLGKKPLLQQTGTVTFTEDELSDIYKQLPNTTKGTIRFTLRTYTDLTYSTQIGNASYEDITLTIPTAVKPSASLVVTAINDNDWIAKKGIYVAGFSQASLKLTATAGEGAKLESVNISGDEFSSNTSSVTLNLQGAGRFTFTGKATDSRNRSATNNKSITVLEYSTPVITSFIVERGTYNYDWTAKETGPDIKVTFKTTLALSDYNNVYGAKFTIDGKVMTPNYGSASALTSGSNAAVYFTALDGEASHNLKLTVTDSVGSASTAGIIIPTIHITAEYNESGKGFSLGKTSEKDAFECGMDAEFLGSVKLIQSNGKEIILEDTGWIDMGTSSNVSAENASDTGRNGPGCYYRVINNNHVYVAFNVAFTFSGSAITVNANALPSKYRPKRKAYAMSLISGRSFARTGVNTAGNVIIDWAQNINSADTTNSASTVWIDGYIDYWI